MGKVKTKKQRPVEVSKPHQFKTSKVNLGKVKATKPVSSSKNWTVENSEQTKQKKNKKTKSEIAPVRWRPVPLKPTGFLDSPSSESEPEEDLFTEISTRYQFRSKPSVCVASIIPQSKTEKPVSNNKRENGEKRRNVKEGKKKCYVLKHDEEIEFVEEDRNGDSALKIKTNRKKGKIKKESKALQSSETVEAENGDKPVDERIPKNKSKPKKDKLKKKIPVPSEDEVMEVTENSSANEEKSLTETEISSLKNGSLDQVYPSSKLKKDKLKKKITEPSEEKVMEVTEDSSANENEKSLTETEISPLKNGSLDQNNPWPETSIDCKFSIVNDKTVLLTLNHPSSLYVHGTLKVSCISGKCEILGYTLTSEPVTIYSLRGSSFLYFETLIPGETVLKLERNDPVNLHFINKHIPQNIIPDLQRSSPLEKLLQCRFAESHDGLTFKKSTDWNNLFSNLSYYPNNSKTMVCGGKSVGKSTFYRYLVNKLLPTTGEVLCVDLDIGQSEFFVPGCVSAVKVTKPLIGPNFTHIMKPDRTYFVGSIDVAISVETYVKSATKLFEYCESTYPNIPWVINTMGFVRNLGEQLAALLIQLFQPSHVVQINAYNYKLNFRNPMGTFVVQDINNRSSVFENSGLRNIKRDYAMFVFNSMAVRPESRNSNDWNLRPRDMRYMNVLSYLSKMLSDKSEKIVEVRPFMAKLNQLEICCPSVNLKLLPAMINGNMVALCDGELCLGFGIVRGVSEEHVYLITPLKRSELRNVKTLKLAAEPLPQSLYELQGCANRTIPYMSIEEKMHTTEVPRRVTFVINKKQLWQKIAENADVIG